MLFFALLCPILIWPLYRQVARYGFARDVYVLAALVGFAVATGIAFLLGATAPKAGLAWLALPIVGIFANHVIFLAIGGLSRPEEVRQRVDARAAIEAARRARLDRVESEATAWPCVKTYVSSGQQYEYLADRSSLDAASIRYLVRSSLITNLHVHPDDLARATTLLGLGD